MIYTNYKCRMLSLMSLILFPCTQSAVILQVCSMGYHEGGVELVLPILVKVIFLYNSSLSIGYSSFPMDHYNTGS